MLKYQLSNLRSVFLFSILLTLLVSFFFQIVLAQNYRKNKNESFSNLCQLVLPRLQTGGIRDVQDYLISLFPPVDRRLEVVPVVKVYGKAIIDQNIIRNSVRFDCNLVGISNISVSFFYRESKLFWSQQFFLISIFFIVIFLSVIVFVSIQRKKSLEKIKHEQELEVARIARQVAHDIRSPLSAMKIALNGILISENRKSVLVEAATRISDIAEDLLLQSRKLEINKKEISLGIKFADQKVNLKDVINIIINENAIVNRPVSITSNLKDIFIRADKGDLERVLSNLINNSFEAKQLSKEVIVSLDVSLHKNLVTLGVRDNGIGMSSDILKNLGCPGFSFNKTNGNGLGVSFAREKIAEWGGEFNVFSKENEGTIVNLTFQRV